ncbi:hypothetical protein DBB36_15705 [Flavobacterium sp. WLB]|nr:hypothetical protein AKO67_21205 [Flavobacterium sp. VMW]OWU90318.1 hypothetical protein APR43_12210 [Flavobacterium sp. NLM]PUU69061.1 hypothetical protein DBB36_15705 [Flavobacterium sp. WLB]
MVETTGYVLCSELKDKDQKYFLGMTRLRRKAMFVNASETPFLSATKPMSLCVKKNIRKEPIKNNP